MQTEKSQSSPWVQLCSEKRHDRQNVIGAQRGVRKVFRAESSQELLCTLEWMEVCNVSIECVCDVLCEGDRYDGVEGENSERQQ